FIGAILEPGAADIDVDQLCQAYTRQLRANGGEIRCGAEVSAIARDDAYWTIETRAGTFNAGLVVNAAGAWADPIAEMAGVARLGLIPHRRSAAIVEFERNLDRDGPMHGNYGETWYAKPEGDWLMVSLADETPMEPCDAWAEDLDIATAIDNFQQSVDTGEVERMVRSWAGLRTFAADRIPVVGFDAKVPDFYWLAGQGGSGIHAGPALAEQAAAEILKREVAEWAQVDTAYSAQVSPTRLAS
ncbi:MAG: FAD-binding oxidoreductase, partial [Pseudomonadota bacterium]